MSFDPPLKHRYWFTVALVLLALVPDLLISTAMPLLRHQIVSALHTSVPQLHIGETFSNAGWAFAAVLASDFYLRFGTRRPLLAYETLFIIGSILCAVASGPWYIVAGRILQGIATGAMLIAALPPLITKFPVSRLWISAAVTGIGLFGAVTGGPLLGGYVAYTGTWRWFFATMALLGLIGLVLDFLVVEPTPPPKPDFPFDFTGITLAAIGAGLTFWGVGNLERYPWTNPIVWIPTAIGLLAIVVLIVVEFYVENGLMPIKALGTTFPVIGIISAIMSGLVFTGLTELFFLYAGSVRGYSVLLTGLVYWPAFITSLAASFIFGRMLNTRYVLVLPLAGMFSLLSVAWIMSTMTTHTGRGELFWIAFLLGAGAGLTVSPGLFIAGLSVAPPLIGRAFSVVEMLRLASAFALVPAFTYFAQIYGMAPEKLVLGMHIVFWVSVCIMAVTIVVTALLFFLGGARLHPPDLSAYIENQQTALESPALGSGAQRHGGVGRSVGHGLRSIAPDRRRGEGDASNGQQSGDESGERQQQETQARR